MIRYGSRKFGFELTYRKLALKFPLCLVLCTMTLQRILSVGSVWAQLTFKFQHLSPNRLAFMTCMQVYF